MKSLLLTLILAISVSAFCNAQTQKGSKMIGGAGGASFNGGLSINISPSLGYFVVDDLVVGSGVALAYNKFNIADYHTISGGIEPFIRYYFGQEATLRVFAQANGSLVYLKGINRGDAHYGTAYTNNSFGGNLGLAYFITEQIGLEARFGYNNYQGAQTRDSQTMYHPRRYTIGLTFGFQVHLP